MRKLCLILFSVMLIGVGGCVVGEGAQVSPPAISAYVAAPEFGRPFGIIYSQQQVGLWVTGEGKATAVPDVVLLSLGIESEAKTVAEAQRNAVEAMNKVMRALKANGIAEKDIQTQRFNISPIRRWIESERREEVIGYQVTNIVVAKVRQVDKAGGIIDSVAEAGGDLTRIQNIGFTVDDPTPYYNEAREEAVKAAMAKAKQIAGISNIKLGRLLYVSEGTPSVPPMRDYYVMKAEGTAQAPTPISPGELEFQVTVQMVYDID
ncbi:MAG: DUF541 domain-containing protein [Chloroflexi bacterium]|nr:DUF541 domain-containing protein [Chloroflexota bacterium]